MEIRSESDRLLDLLEEKPYNKKELSFEDFNVTIAEFENIDSTQTQLNKILPKMTNNKEILLLRANEQSKGKGRGNNKWISPPNNLYMSFSIILEDPEVIGLLPCVASLSVQQYLKNKTKHDFGIKWVNDVYYQGKKVNGILCESTFVNNKYNCIIGIGVNMIKSVDLNSALYQSGDVQSLTGMNLSLTETCEGILKQFLSFINNMKQDRFKGIQKVYSDSLLWKSKTVQVTDHFTKKVTTGILIGVNSNGHLIVFDTLTKTQKEFENGSLVLIQKENK